MNLKFASAILMAVIAGIGFGDLACRSIRWRDTIGRVCGRGRLLALVETRGIYDADVARAAARVRSRRDELDSKEDVPLRESILSRLIGATAVQCIATQEKIAASDVERELRLLQTQFRDRKTWMTALRVHGLSERSLRRMLKDDLRARKWIDRQIAPQLEVTNDERRQFYEQHAKRFVLPVRFRVSHLFLAAPPETAPEIVDLKKEKIALLAKRIKNGKNFSELVAVESEDEASKARGGDLGYFSAYRMPPDFFAAAAKLRPGEISAPIKTVLGFHILQATEIRPARQMTFEEVSEETRQALEQGKRQATLGRVDVDLRAGVRVIGRAFEGKL